MLSAHQISSHHYAIYEGRWDEIGKYDIPAVINYILTETGLSKLIYTGHSLGGAFFFIAMITNPELRDKIEMMVLGFNSHYLIHSVSNDDYVLPGGPSTSCLVRRNRDSSSRICSF